MLYKNDMLSTLFLKKQITCLSEYIRNSSGIINGPTTGKSRSDRSELTSVSLHRKTKFSVV